MSGFKTVFKRELKSYFATPVAYVFLVCFLFFSGYLTFRQGFFLMRQADMRLFFGNIPLLFIFVAPSISMRLFSEEFKSGSFELLLTLPITVSAAVLGKFFAAWTFVATALLLTFPMPLTVAYLGNPDVGLIFSGYFASILLSGACLAIGIFFSSLSKNQVISFILTVICCAFFVYSGMPTAQTYLSSILPISLSESVASLNFLDNFMPLVKGMASLGSVLYFVIVIAAWLYACCLVVEARRNG